MPGALDIPDDLLERFHRFAGHDELVLQEALGTVATVPLTDQVKRLVELRQILHLVTVRAGFQPPQFTNGHHRQLIHGEIRENIRNSHQLGRVELKRCLRQLRRILFQLVQRGKRAAGDCRAAKFRCRGDGIKPCRGIGVVLL